MILVATFLTPTKESRKISVKGTVAVIGRDDCANIQLDHPSVSREHAQLALVDGKSHFTIEDLGSANGTYIDGRLIPKGKRRRLGYGQEITLGGPVSDDKVCLFEFSPKRTIEPALTETYTELIQTCTDNSQEFGG